MQVFPMTDYHDHSYCMQHCGKLGGRSPAVNTIEEWRLFYEEMHHTKVDPSLDFLWLSATEGDKDLKLSRLDHWPEGIEAVEGVWRDYYTGEKLENYTNLGTVKTKMILREVIPTAYSTILVATHGKSGNVSNQRTWAVHAASKPHQFSI